VSEPTTNRPDEAIRVERVSEVTEGLIRDVARLVPQVSSSASLPTEAEMADLVGSSGSTLFVARDAGDAMVGMLTLVTYRIPTGIRAVIEDVVVDERARGAGVGGLLVEAALAESARRQARHVDLTSRPSREAANRLYQKMGFGVRETNVYRHSMS
jgi:ribosomal protein S18 acetylase RimI-like enzyme